MKRLLITAFAGAVLPLLAATTAEFVNTVGIIKVESPNKNTVVAIPFHEADGNVANPNPVTVARLVNPKNLTAGDKLYAYDKDSAAWACWVLGEDGTWTGATTVTAEGTSVAAGADTAQIAAGSAIWVERQNPKDTSGTVKPFYIFGQWQNTTKTISIPAGKKVLVANPLVEDIDLNRDVAWVSAPSKSDSIILVNDTALSTVVRWSGSEWKCWNKALKQYTNVVTIPRGTGFWYVRAGESAISASVAKAQPSAE